MSLFDSVAAPWKAMRLAGAELARVELRHLDDELGHLLEDAMHEFGLLEHPHHHAVLAEDRAGPREGRPDLQGHRHPVLRLEPGDLEGDGQRSGLGHVLRHLQSEGLLLVRHRMPRDDRSAGVLLVRKLDVAAELPAPRGGVHVQGSTVVSVHLLTEHLAPEALRSVVEHARERLSAHQRGVPEHERDDRDPVWPLSLHEGGHPFGARHRLLPHGSQPPSADPAQSSWAMPRSLFASRAASIALSP